MKQNVYTIKDAKSGTYSNPFISINDETAKRSFAQASADPNTTISQYPEDYALFKIATWDDEAGTYSISENAPEFISNAIVNRAE